MGSTRPAILCFHGPGYHGKDYDEHYRDQPARWNSDHEWMDHDYRRLLRVPAIPRLRRHEGSGDVHGAWDRLRLRQYHRGRDGDNHLPPWHGGRELRGQDYRHWCGGLVYGGIRRLRTERE